MDRRRRARYAAALAGPVTTPTGETITLTLQPASWHSRLRASYEGTYGSTVAGRYLQIPATGGGTDRYVYWTQDDGTGRYTGIDPGPYVAALSGYTGVEVQLAAGAVTAADRATATRTALTGLYTTIGGTGADVEITGELDAATCAVGGLGEPSEAGMYGTRRQSPVFAVTDLSGRVAQFGVSPAFDCTVTALGIYLNGAATDVRVALYSGGTQASLTGTTLEAEVVIPAGGTDAWTWVALTPAQVFDLPTSTNFRLVLKSNGTSEPGYTSTGTLTGTDWPDAGGGSTYSLEIYDTMSTDPAVAFPSTLAGEGITTSPVYVHAAFQYSAADGTSGVFRMRLGLSPEILPAALAQTSSLTAPDADGADLFMGVANPGILGAQLSSWHMVYGTQHSTQMRAFVAQGGSIGDGDTSTVVWQSLTSGSATDSWVDVAASGSLNATDVIWWGVRNDVSTANLRFALNANRETATPDWDPADWTDASEYEILNTGGLYVTDPATSVGSPIDVNGATTATNTNYPGSGITIVVPADEVV